MKKYIVFSAIGFELVGIMIASIYLGDAIDKSYQTKGIAIAGLMFLGLASWLTHVVMLLRRFEKENSSDKESE